MVLKELITILWENFDCKYYVLKETKFNWADHDFEVNYWVLEVLKCKGKRCPLWVTE